MNTLLPLLAFYYLCDVTAATRPLDRDEMTACMANYETIKLAFAPDDPPAATGTPDRAAQNRKAYAQFKAWESANKPLVDEMRAEAIAQISDGA